MWKEWLAPTGALKQSLLEDFIAPRPPHLSEEDTKYFVETFGRNGFAAPTCWFKIMTNQLSAKDDQRASLNPRGSVPLSTADARVFCRDPARAQVAAGERANLLCGGERLCLRSQDRLRVLCVGGVQQARCDDETVRRGPLADSLACRRDYLRY